jgi:phosphatidylinositol alpha 1,6-mannosyltransferase
LTRVAYFPDSFREINGVAHTSRHFEDYARGRKLPFLCVRAGDRAEALVVEDNLTTLELPRGILSVPLDKDLKFDPAWVRHDSRNHAHGPSVSAGHYSHHGSERTGDIGRLACARRLGVPLAASWHTNVHEYAATRSRWFLDWLPKREAAAGARLIEELVLRIVASFYRRASVLFAPNLELCRLLEARAGRPCHLMQRGIDAQLFSPERRDRGSSGSGFVLGFVGRLSVEKNVALLARVQTELEARGIRDFRFRIVGQGAEEGWLRQRLPRAEFTGVLRGEALARAYAGMDVFLFPSHTDTFGNVVLEAMASGVPAVVTPDGGPRSLVQDGRTGFIANDADFSVATARILEDSVLRETMRVCAREYALKASWDAVFEGVYAAYGPLLHSGLSRTACGCEAGASV